MIRTSKAYDGGGCIYDLRRINNFETRLQLQPCKDTEDNAQTAIVQACIGPITRGMYI